MTSSDASVVITDEFCVMTPLGPHPAYGVKESLAAARGAIRFDGGADLFVACRVRTVTTTKWEPVEWPEEGQR